MNVNPLSVLVKKIIVKIVLTSKRGTINVRVEANMKLINTADAAELMHCSEEWVRELARVGKLTVYNKSHKVGSTEQRIWRYDRSAVLRIVAEKVEAAK
jgi:hypothetical protein